MQKMVVCLSVLAATATALPVAAQQDPELLTQARSIASEIPPKLLAVLQEEITKGGPEEAMAVCREKAPQMAKAASEKTGWNIRRVSLKNRNPNATPDALEKAALEEFAQRQAAGQAPATLEKGELITEGTVPTYRYIKALPTQTLCLSCHGNPDNFSPSFKAKLHSLYPHDKATGYAPGEIRGAITLKRAL